MIINGGKIADGIIADLQKRPKPNKSLVVIRVGDEPTMVSFIKKKEEEAKRLGINFKIDFSPASIKESELLKKISEVADDPECGGIVLQLPLPEEINREEIIKMIPPEKDVDNLTGKAPVSAPAVGTVDAILQSLRVDIQNSRTTVVGMGFLVGRPVAEWLKGKCAEIQTIDSDDNLENLKQRDVVISGVGKAGLIKPEMLKENTLMIDFGYDFKNGKTHGDFDALKSTSTITYTPTPGGTGPILVAKLFENFYKLNA